MGRLLDTHKYWDERLKKNWGLDGVGDISRGKGYNDWLYRVQRVVFSRIIEQLPLNLSKARILDIGPGVGFYVELWKKAGVRNVTGVDISDYATEKLKERFPDDQFIVGDISEDIAYEKIKPYGPFDVISAFAVLYHIVDAEKYQKAYENMHNLLKPGGYLIFSENLLHGREVASAHQVSRSKETIEKILNTNHFRIIWSAPEFVFMATPIDSTRPLSWFFWKVVNHLISLGNLIGFLIGAILCPFEVLATGMKKESQSTEVLICRLEE